MPWCYFIRTEPVFFFFTVPLLNLHFQYSETHNFALSAEAWKKNVQMFWILSRRDLSLSTLRSALLLKSTILTAIACYPPITLRALMFTICKMIDGLHSYALKYQTVGNLNNVANGYIYTCVYILVYIRDKLLFVLISLSTQCQIYQMLV